MYFDELKNVRVTAKLGFKIALQMPVALVEVQSIYRDVFGQLAQHCPNGDLHELSNCLNSQLRVDEKLEGTFDDHELIEALDTQQWFDEPTSRLSLPEAYALAGMWRFFGIQKGDLSKEEKLLELCRAQALANKAVRAEGFQRVAGQYVGELEQLALAYTTLISNTQVADPQFLVLTEKFKRTTAMFVESGLRGNDVQHGPGRALKNEAIAAWNATDITTVRSISAWVGRFLLDVVNKSLLEACDVGDVATMLRRAIAAHEASRGKAGMIDRRTLLKATRKRPRAR